VKRAQEKTKCAHTQLDCIFFFVIYFMCGFLANIPWYMLWPAAVDMVLTAYALADYGTNSNAERHACGGTDAKSVHLPAVAIFILSMLAIGMVVVVIGGAICAERVKDVYALAMSAAVFVLAVWAPLEAFFLTCHYGGFLWTVVAVHGCLCLAAVVLIGVANAFAFVMRQNVPPPQTRAPSQYAPPL
jgi:hypothetical protein